MVHDLTEQLLAAGAALAAIGDGLATRGWYSGICAALRMREDWWSHPAARIA